MSDKTGIEWTDATWNPVTGCTKVSQGCKHCYAERVFPRAYAGHTVGVGPRVRRLRKFTDVLTHPERLDVPLHWKRPRRIFVNSMSDLFHDDVPESFIDQVFAVMTQADRHTYQVLTKRPERMHRYVHDWQRRAQCSIAPNVWLGVSVEDQATADERIPLLLRTPAAVRFLSCEPLLGAIDLRSHLEGHCALHDFASGFCVQRDHPEVQRLGWVIVGGESGRGARPMHPKWARDIRDQCVAAGVPFLFKQWGEYLPCGMATDQPHNTNRSPRGGEVDGHRFVLIGKKAAGRLLDERTWDEYPA